MEVAAFLPPHRQHNHPDLPRNHSVPARFKSYNPPPMPNSTSSVAHFSTYSQPSSLRSSDSTQATSQSTLFNPPPLPTGTPPVYGAPVQADNNVLNKRADKEASLFQICLNLRKRLSGVPGLEDLLTQEEEESDEDTDIVTLLWRTFRQGYPLMAIYNALQPRMPLTIDESKVNEKKRGQAASFKFLQACVNELKFPTEECFIITDLYGDDTTGFVKVSRVVNRVLDILVREGILDPNLPESNATDGLPGNTKRTHRQHVIHELVQTERTYVQHLEMLQEFKKVVEEQGVIPGDAVHDIFLNLNQLLDFQRRFLIRVEQTNDKSEDEQNWGSLFVLYKDAFKVYEPYIANQKKCETIAMLHFNQLKTVKCKPELRSMVDSQTVLTSFLLKPFQRLSKYPLLLRELRDKGDLDEIRKADIDAGIIAAQGALLAANAAVDREERNEAVQELRERVEDWKGHRLDAFGELLLHGNFSVIKGDPSTSKDQEREVTDPFVFRNGKKVALTESQYKIYLFENILLCCKEMQATKKKNIGKQLQDRKGRPRLQLKGRIFMQNVTDTIVTSKPGDYQLKRDIHGQEVTVYTAGSYTCQIFWKGDPGIEFFTIRFTTEETLRKWAEQVEMQRRDHLNGKKHQTGTTSVSETEFEHLKNLNIPNPYREDDDDDDDDDAASGTLVDSQTGYSIGRNESSTSLRSRSATGDSGPPMGGRVPPRQFPLGAQAPVLQVRTQQPPMSQPPGASSPNEWIMDSYFSPTAESPISTRSSGQSGMFPFPRQIMSNGWVPDEHARFTAPAIPRQQSREGSVNGYQGNARNAMQRPSLPPSAATTGSMPQNRMRSASSPDIQHPIVSARRTIEPGSQPGVPDLPPFPQHYAYQPAVLNRSQTTNPQGVVMTGPVGTAAPVRAATSSPTAQRLPSRGGPSPYPGGVQHPPPMPRAGTMGSIDRTISPQQPEMRSMTPASIDSALRPVTPGSIASTSRSAAPPLSSDQPLPSQLKIKVHCPSAGSSMVLVVPSNISYQSLKDRIDAKLQRSTNLSLSNGSVRLKYLDDEDFVSIQSDEDVTMAFETWNGPGGVGAGMYPEIELYCQ